MRNFFAMLTIWAFFVTHNSRCLAQGVGYSAKNIAAGANHTVVLKDDGTVWGFGYSDFGQLGSTWSIYKSAPVQAIGLNDIVQITAGSHHTVALKNDGTLWSYGLNEHGQLGNGAVWTSPTPLQVLETV